MEYRHACIHHFSIILPACGNLSSLNPGASMLKVRVYGVYDAPSGAKGNHTPTFYELAIDRVSSPIAPGRSASLLRKHLKP